MKFHSCCQQDQFSSDDSTLVLAHLTAFPTHTMWIGNCGEDATPNFPTGGTAAIKETEIDFGAVPVAEGSFTVVDLSVTASSKIIGNVAYVAPTGKDLDELEMDTLDLKFAPGTGQFTIYAACLTGHVADKFKINYLVG